MVLTVLGLLHRGVEFSDTGFYYNSIFNLDEIDMQTTQFGVVWQFLSFSDSFLLHRIAVFVLIWAGAYFLVRQTHEFCVDASSDWVVETRHAFLAGLAVTPFYRNWVPDPSYNALGYILLLFMGALALRVAVRLSQSHNNCRAEMMTVGALLIPLFLTRPLAPLIVAIVAVPLVLVTARPRLGQLAKAAGWLLVGVVGYLAYQTLAVEPPWTTLDRIGGGLERRALLERDGALARGLERFFEDFSKYGARDWATYLPLSAFATLVLVRRQLPSRFWQAADWARVTLLAVVAASLAFGASGLDAVFGQAWLQSVDFGAMSFTILISTASALVITPAIAVLSRAPVGLWIKDWAALLMMLTLCVAAFFGTGSNWLVKFQFFSGTLIVLFGIFLMAERTGTFWKTTAIFLVLSYAYVFVSMKHAYQLPYRLPSDLSTQREPVEAVRGMAFMRVDPSTRSFMEDIASLQSRLPETGPNPALIDLSGRLPMVAFLLDLSTPRTPWALSGYSGSQALFDHTIASLDEETVRNAWILESPARENSHDPAVLARHGIAFPDDYDPVLETWSDYVQSPIIIWIPRHALRAVANETGPSEPDQ
ncbi:hypothetical protein [Maricaulis sp.]|uniref:hypothetical protein n=1 Tax=Maricaulis sp. TaxID=1486257 RepID=UPI002B27AFB0|nr:hypothetical protein [Maricaulis sp.]